MNDVRLLGRLTATPELRTTTNGKKVLNFTLAVNRIGKDAGTDFIQLVAWEKTAEFVAQHFDKGQQMVVEAKLRTRTVKDKETEKERTVLDVVVDQVFFCGSKPGTPANAEAPAVEETVEDYEEIE